MDNFDLKKYLAEGKLNEGRTDVFYKILEKVWDDAVDSVNYDENHGYSSGLFSEYWDKNRGEFSVKLRSL